MLDEILAKLGALPEKEKQAVIAEVMAATKDDVWIPNPGPQTEAYYSKADVLLFGGCVSGDTEYLSPAGWKRIDQYDGGCVAQWAPSGELSFVSPDHYTDAPCSELIRFSNTRVSMLLSDQHRVPLYDWAGKFVVKPAADVAKCPSRHKIPVNYRVDLPGLPLSDDEIRLAVAVHADGSLEYKRKTDGKSLCRMSLRKERKKARLKSLLTILGIEWTEYHNPKRPTEIRYSFESPIQTKSYADEWWTASQRQLEIVLAEMSYWDGDISGVSGGDVTFNSARKVDSDFIQHAAHACGRVATIREKRNGENHSPVWRVQISRDGSVKSSVVLRGDAIVIDRVRADRMYCFTVPTSFWLARHNGFVFVTGNSPGGGKSALEIGLGLTQHYRTLIVRKNFSDLEGLIDNAKKMVGTDAGFIGGMRPKYRKPDGGVIHFAGLAQDGGIGGHQGVDHDLLCVDEAATIPENQIRLLIGWVRTDREGQRCRVLLASNPPLDSTGDWLIDYFAPWLDPRHPNPGKPGELRYYLPKSGGGDYECDPDERAEINGVTVYPQSRTFIPSKFTDNPFYDPEQYAKSLAGLPDHAREILVTGNFMLGRKDDPWQLIPTDWVKQAQARWTKDPPKGIPMCAMGVDVAQGGDDNNVIARRHDGWFDELIVVPGKMTPLGTDIGGEVIKRRRDGAVVVLDCGGGYGGSAFKNLKENGIEVMAYKGAEESRSRTEDRMLSFKNKRSECWWRFREALDPDQPGGSRIALPPDQRLLSDLTSPTYKTDSNVIQIEPKKDLIKRIGRSTDHGDAVIMSWAGGPKISTSYNQWQSGIGGSSGRAPKVVMGRDSARRRR